MTRISQQSQSTSQAVLSLIKRHGRITAKELAGALGVTGMAVRKHLAVLSASGLVTHDTERRPRGRPVGLYRLTEAGDEGFPKDYPRLLLSVLAQVARAEGPDRVPELVQVYQAALPPDAQERLKSLPLEQRVAEVTTLLDARGHMAEWRPHPEGYVIVEHNCPISRVSREYPECCDSELNLLSGLLGAHVERLTDQPAGDLQCSYLVRKPPA